MADCTFMRAEEETKRIHQKLEQKNFSVGSKAERFNEKTREPTGNKFNAKSKDRNFRIMKKNIVEKRLEIESMGIGIGFGSPMMVTGLGNNQPTLATQPQLNRSRPPIRHNF